MRCKDVLKEVFRVGFRGALIAPVPPAVAAGWEVPDA